MTIEINRLGRGERDEWNRYVDRSTESTAFHRGEVLDTVEEHANSTVYRLVGYKGQEPVGVFPVFELKWGPFKTAFSPPPRLGIPYLGPATIDVQQAKQRSIAQANQEFVEGCLDVVGEEIDPNFFHIKTVPGFSDPRPFQWEGFDATPRYTYTLPLSQGVEALKAGFSRSLRRYLDPSPDDDVAVEERGRDAVDFVLDQVDARYADQGKTFTVSPAFVHDLREALPDGWVRTYVGTVDGEDVSGVITLESPERVYFLQGGGKSDVGYPINDLLHWKIARAAAERGVREYDLMGANVEGIARYKSKFNPTLDQYLELERGTWPMRLASGAYRRFR